MSRNAIFLEEYFALSCTKDNKIIIEEINEPLVESDDTKKVEDENPSVTDVLKVPIRKNTRIFRPLSNSLF